MSMLRWTVILLLAFVAGSAVVGAVPMIANPYGSPLGLPHSVLHTTPFRSFLAPGLLLLFFNGLLALWCLWLAWERKGGCGVWTVFQGVVLLTWVIVECLMLRTVVWAHYLYGVVAAGLMIAGVALESGRRPARRSLDW